MKAKGERSKSSQKYKSTILDNIQEAKGEYHIKPYTNKNCEKERNMKCTISTNRGRVEKEDDLFHRFQLSIHIAETSHWGGRPDGPLSNVHIFLKGGRWNRQSQKNSRACQSWRVCLLGRYGATGGKMLQLACSVDSQSREHERPGKWSPGWSSCFVEKLDVRNVAKWEGCRMSLSP
ncbi:hypothetical protein AVEN_190311-1 [Araneus ventricosus]|uniref:Uncharacterized protein n=1 Tax=Araneus ventricosus TaxID=182803 RepID=A0A4Y2TI76_ARAVE|nr:hypothetical protein AVEN_190311-1 [Araneus ventricosus]